MDFLKPAYGVSLLFASGAAFATFFLHLRGLAHPHIEHAEALPAGLARRLRNGRRRLLSRVLDVAGFFGADMGGSLTKLVFFLPDDEMIGRLRQVKDRPEAARDVVEEKIDALQRVGDFILAHDNYGGTGTRDAALQLHVNQLGGTLHFIRFETKRMENALLMARRRALHVGMSRLCATGGGAIRVSGNCGCLARDVESTRLSCSVF